MTRPTTLCDFTHADHVSHSHGQHVVAETESHRNGRHLLTALLESERRPPHKAGRIFLTVVGAATGYAAICLLALYVLSKAGF